MKKKKKYPSDTEVGIRSITTINSLPAGQLSDEEFTKAFFHRFGAKALLLLYTDEEGETHGFGRLFRGAQRARWYRTLLEYQHKLFTNKPNLNDLEIDEGKKTYMIIESPASGKPAIKCFTCGYISYHPRDIEEKYCGNCHKFHV